MSTGKVAFFGPWIGELGWELMTWQAWCRKKSREFDKSYACSFPDMAPLYEDFATFIPHDHVGRALDWQKEENMDKAHFEMPDDVTDKILPPKSYKHTDGEWINFGDDLEELTPFKYVIHARGIGRGGKDYPIDQWEKLVKCLDSNLPGDIISVGTLQDHHIKGTHNGLGMDLKNLMWTLASARCAIGQSSGVMHLASLCGTPHVVWGDSKVQFGGEKLDQRYAATWNPLNTPFRFIFDDKWAPDFSDVVMQVRDMHHERAVTKIPKVPRSSFLPPELKEKLQDASETGKYMITISYLEGTRLRNFWLTENFDDEYILPCIENIESEIKKTRAGKMEVAEKIEPTKTGISEWY
jgi:hypothetical protein